MTPNEIKAYREKIGLSQQSFAERLGISIVTYNQIEQGKGKDSSLRRFAIDKIKRMKNGTDKGV